MSGHSKWSQIKHKKALTDSKKSKEFGKLARLIAVESKRVGGDASAPTLLVYVNKAKAVNMPKDNIERAIAKGKGGGMVELSQATYELYGPGGVALMIDAVSDNTNRTVAELKHLVSKLGLELATPGSASWAFTKDGADWVPTTTLPLTDEDADKLALLVDALEAHDDVEQVYTNAE